MISPPSAFERSRMPLYLQVAKLMRQKIESQEWPYGSQIPTLDALEKDYQVSRITLRAALAQLEEEGIVRRTRGRGTFVSKDLSQQRWFRLASNFNDLVRTVSNLQIRLLEIDQKEVSLTPAFEFGTVAPAYHRLRRVHYHNNEPYCVIELYLHRDIYQRDPEGFSSAPVVPQLAQRPDVHVAQGRQIMRITVSDEDTANHLGIGVGDPIADVCRSLLDDSGQIIYYAHIQYPAHMIQIDTDLMAGHASNHVSPSPAARRTRRKVSHD